METYRCRRHRTEITVDREHRSYSGDFAGPVPSCDLLRRAHELVEHANAILGDSGPWDPRAGGPRCHIERVG